MDDKAREREGGGEGERRRGVGSVEVTISTVGRGW